MINHDDSMPDAEPKDTRQNAGNRKQPSSGRRRDSGQLHRVRHGVLGREALSALIQLGENPKTYRRLEREFHAALRPTGPWGNLLFDRFWSCYLRLMLIARLETQLLGRKSPGDASTSPALLVPGEQPTLVLPGGTSEAPNEEQPKMELPRDLLQQLVLAQRYDRHHAREMYRALALLLLLRRGGEPALETWAAEMLGAAGCALVQEEPTDA